MPSCGFCKTVLITNTIWCKKCRSVCYCSVNCQAKDIPVHTRTCVPDKKNVVGWGPDSNVMALNNGVSKLPGGPPKCHNHGFKKLPPNSIGGIAEDWTSDLPRNATLYERAYERLIDAYRLRVEDAKVHGNMETGLYVDGCTPIDILRDFAHFVKNAKKRNQLPKWWNGQCDKQLMAMAKNRIQRTTTKDQVAENRGPFEPMILRMLAEKVYGIPVPLRA